MDFTKPLPEYVKEMRSMTNVVIAGAIFIQSKADDFVNAWYDYMINWSEATMSSNAADGLRNQFYGVAVSAYDINAGSKRPSGVLQAPSGFSQGQSNGNPTTPMEKIYVLTNNYKQVWTLKPEEAANAAREELVKLQKGDPENVALWKGINSVSVASFEKMYKLMGLTIDFTLGESFYRDKVGRIYSELAETGIAEEDGGALVVFLRDHDRFKTQPFIIRKSDGASNYASTDLATLLYRVEHFGAEEVVYVTDGRQQDHFQQLFLTAKKWFGAKGYRLPELRHVWFGTILGEDGKAIKTKSGEPVRLKTLIDESVSRAKSIVLEKNPDIDAREADAIANTVGIAALKYDDLVQNRTSDYVFSWDKLLAFEGNTAPYLLYAAARLHSIFRKAGVSPSDPFELDASPIETEQETALARKLVALPAVFELTLSELRPHYLCNYLYELSGIFSTFYNADKVIVDDRKTMARRLMLCSRTLGILECGLRLLGIEPLEKM